MSQYAVALIFAVLSYLFYVLIMEPLHSRSFDCCRSPHGILLVLDHRKSAHHSSVHYILNTAYQIPIDSAYQAFAPFITLPIFITAGYFIKKQQRESFIVDLNLQLDQQEIADRIRVVIPPSISSVMQRGQYPEASTIAE